MARQMGRGGWVWVESQVADEGGILPDILQTACLVAYHGCWLGVVQYAVAMAKTRLWQACRRLVSWARVVGRPFVLVTSVQGPGRWWSLDASNNGDLDSSHVHPLFTLVTRMHISRLVISRYRLIQARIATLLRKREYQCLQAPRHRREPPTSATSHPQPAASSDSY